MIIEIMGIAIHEGNPVLNQSEQRRDDVVGFDMFWTLLICWGGSIPHGLDWLEGSDNSPAESICLVGCETFLCLAKILSWPTVGFFRGVETEKPRFLQDFRFLAEFLAYR